MGDVTIQFSPALDAALRERMAREYGDTALSNFCLDIIVKDMQVNLIQSEQRCVALQERINGLTDQVAAQDVELKKYREEAGDPRGRTRAKALVQHRKGTARKKASGDPASVRRPQSSSPVHPKESDGANAL